MIIDTSLREGLQLFNVFFTQEQKKEIITDLANSKIEEIEIGWTKTPNIKELALWSGPVFEKSVISVWSPLREEDIVTASEFGIKRINIGVPSSRKHMETRLGLNENSLLKRIETLVSLGNLLGLEVSVGMEDIYDADFTTILNIIRAVENSGGFRIRFSDTKGIMSPSMINELVSFFKPETSLKTAVHCHNDYGMSCANSITALESGADYTDASILGIGERSGISKTEEIAARLKIFHKKSDYDLIKLKNLCLKISEIADIALSRTKPFFGSDIFACETGIHLHAIKKDPLLMEPYPPRETGNIRSINIGWKSGKNAIIQFLKNKGVNTDKSQTQDFILKVKEISFAKKRSLFEPELELLISEMFESNNNACNHLTI